MEAQRIKEPGSLQALVIGAEKLTPERLQALSKGCIEAIFILTENPGGCRKIIFLNESGQEFNQSG